MAPLKGHLHTFHIQSTPNSPIEVCYSEKKLKHAISFDRLRGTECGTSDSDGTVSRRMTSQIVTKKSKPITSVPLTHSLSSKSLERTGSRSSTSTSSNVSRSPRPRSGKMSSTSLQSIKNVLQDNTTVTATTPIAATVSAKRLVRKSLDVSPAMMEFFGMKPVTGSSACFQFIEEREVPSFRKNKRYGGLRESNSVPAAMSDESGSDRSGEITKIRHMKRDMRHLGEPGPEHLPGRETSDDLYMVDNETEVMMKKGMELERMRKDGNKWRDEMKRLAKNGLSHDYEQRDEPGPEYRIGDSEDGGSRIEEKECISNSLSILAIRNDAVGVACSSNAVREGGGIGGGPSTMVTTNATADAAQSSLGEVAAVAVAAAASASAATTTTTVPAVTGITMDSGNGGACGSILIKGVQIINDDSIYTADVFIQDGIIQ